MSGQSKVSIIIPAYNAEDEIEECIRGLLQQDYDKNLIEIFIVDNNSKDSTVQKIKAYDRISLLCQNEIQSSYASRNLAISQANGDILVFTDSDCILTPQWLSSGIDCMSETGADIVGGNIEFTFTKKPDLFEKYDSIYHMNQRATVARGRSVTANIFIKSEVFGEVGVFRNDLISGGDSEWCERAIKAGFKMEFCEKALLYHPARIGYKANLKKEKRIGYGEGQIRMQKPKFKSPFREIIKILLRLPFDTARYAIPLIKSFLGKKIGFIDFMMIASIAKWFFLKKRFSTIRYILEQK